MVQLVYTAIWICDNECIRLLGGILGAPSILISNELDQRAPVGEHPWVVSCRLHCRIHYHRIVLRCRQVRIRYVPHLYRQSLARSPAATATAGFSLLLTVALKVLVLRASSQVLLVGRDFKWGCRRWILVPSSIMAASSWLFDVSRYMIRRQATHWPHLESLTSCIERVPPFEFGRLNFVFHRLTIVMCVVWNSAGCGRLANWQVCLAWY